LNNQKAVYKKWDFSKKLSHKDNVEITNNVIDFVAVQITSITNMPWTNSVSLRDLKAKISMVYRRQKTDDQMPSEKRELFKKENIRKTRRVTVSSLQ
jgi:hypothetical protein